MGKLFTLAEAAKIIGVTKQTLRNWDASGKLKARRTTGNQRFYDEHVINEFLRKDRLEGIIGGEKWYLREFDFYPEPISDRLDRWPMVHPSLNKEEVINCFRTGAFNWFNTYDECARASMEIRRKLNFAFPSDDEEFICRIRKNGFKEAGYKVD